MRRKIFALALALCMIFGVFAAVACSGNEIPDGDGLIHVDSVQFDGEDTLSLQVGQSVALSYTVLPENAITKAARLTSSDDSVVSVDGDSIRAEKVGSATVTVTTIDSAKTDTVQVNVSDIVVLDSNKYSAELVPERDARIDFHADGSVSYGDRATVTVKQNGSVLGVYPVTVDFGNNASCLLEDLGITETGKYDFEVAFPGNPDAALDAVWVSDVEQRYYVTQAEGWSASAAPVTGGWEAADQHGTLKEDQVIVATGADTFGAVGLNVTLNNGRAPFIRFRVANLDRAVWAAKVLATVTADGRTVYVGADSRIVEEVSDTEVTVDLRETTVKIISSPTSLVGTGEFLSLGDIEGDYQVTLQLFIVGTNGARDGSVTMESVEIFREDGERTAAVRTDKYVGLESATAADVNVNIGETATVTPSLVGAGGAAPSFAEVIYVPQDESIATVSYGGVVKGVGGGTTTVEIRRYDGLKLGEFTVNVRVPVQSLSFDTLSAELTPNGRLDLAQKLQIAPSTATNKGVTFESSNTGVVTVSADGVVTAVGTGNAKITAVSLDDGTKTAQIEIIVSDAIVPVESISLDHSSETLQVGGTLALHAEISPSSATNKTLVWSSSDSGVAAVDADGNVTAVGAGTAAITVTADGTQVTASCTVTVEAQQFRYVAETGAFADDLLYLGFGGVQDGDTVILTFEKEGATFTAIGAIGKGYASLYIGDIQDFEAGTYTVTVSVTRDGGPAAGFTCTSAKKYDIVYDACAEGEWLRDWGGAITQDGSAFSSTGDMAAIQQTPTLGAGNYKLIVHSASFESLGGGAMYAFKFTLNGGGEVAVGGDLISTYAEVIDLQSRGFGEGGTIKFSVIVQNAKVTFGTLAVVSGETALEAV